MADRNRNFLRDSINLSKNPTTNHRIAPVANNNLNGGEPLSPTSRKEGLYAKKENSNYQRFVDYPKDAPPKVPRKQNSLENDVDAPSKERLKKGPAPLVGWQNGSPTLFSSSPEDASPGHLLPLNNHEAALPQVPAAPETPSESSGIGRDDEDTENLSSIADERGIPSTPGLTIDKSLDSFSPDVDLSLATASNPDLDEDLEVKNLDFESPGTECTEDRVPATPTESYLTSPNLTVGVSPTDRPDRESSHENNRPVTERVGSMEKSESSLERTQGILVRRQYSEPDSTTRPSLMYQERIQSQDNEKDSIDGSDAMLEIYDDDDSESSSGNVGKNSLPDGGWGWVVVASSLVISMIADGVSFSFGLLYIEFLHEFNASKSTTAWIGSLFMAVPLLSGPIMSGLVDRYGCRKMTIMGGIISGTGFVLSSYAHSIGVMYLTFGVLAGLGLGLCYVTAVVSITYWFDKKRTLAVGLGACGTGIGTFVYAPMTTFFIEEYGWRGCVLLLAGTFFNMIVCGTVMRDPDWWLLKQKKDKGMLSPKKSQAGLGSKSQDGGRSQNSPVDEDFPGREELRRLMKSGQAPEYLLQNLSTSTEMCCSPGGNPTFRSVVNLPTFVRQSEKVCSFMLNLGILECRDDKYQTQSLRSVTARNGPAHQIAETAVKYNVQSYKT